jgi:RNA polymerase sigma-70 factor (sigma-E family)
MKGFGSDSDVASAGDRGSAGREFRRFVVDFSPTLLRGAYLLLHDASLAEDAVQATLLRVFRRWDRAQAAPEAYSRQTLISVCRDQWRRQQRRLVEIPAGMTPTAGDEVSFTEAVERRQALDQALEALPGAQREVLVLRFFFDLSVAETAALLKVAEGTVKSATHRGLEQLRELLSSSREVNPC